MTCERCGCTDDNACIVDGEPCSWARDGLCDACLTPEEWAEVDRIYHASGEMPPAPPAPLLYDAYGRAVR